MKRWAWFSCGAASAVLSKLAVERYGADVEVAYCDTMASEHEDNRRFLDDVQRWIGRPISVYRSERYATVDDVFEQRRYMSGIHGAVCTTEMKKRVRERVAGPLDIHLLGFTADEHKRCDSFEANNPDLRVEWLLVDEWLTKQRCLEIVTAAGIALPAMYQWFDHNNCKGCVKSKSPGYWNKTREHFPETFERRARQSRLLGVRLVVLKGSRIFLDELPPNADAPDDAIECGPTCQLPLDFGGAT